MKIAIVDERISDACACSLEKYGFWLIRIKKYSRLGEGVYSHPDMIMFAHGKTIITSADYCEEYPYIFSDIREFLPEVSITFTSDIQGHDYPRDAIFNALTVENKIFLKADSISPSVIDYAKKASLKQVNVRLGYPACSVLSFGNSAITADEGMARALENEGVNVTLLRAGGISLPPFEYGFIGGACGVFEDRVYFLGDYKTHPDKDLIEKAIKEENYTPVSLSSEPLCDLGRIIFLAG